MSDQLYSFCAIWSPVVIQPTNLLAPLLFRLRPHWLMFQSEGVIYRSHDWPLNTPLVCCHIQAKSAKKELWEKEKNFSGNASAWGAGGYLCNSPKQWRLFHSIDRLYFPSNSATVCRNTCCKPDHSLILLKEPQLRSSLLTGITAL